MSEALSVPFEGQHFRIADSIGLMPLMQFAHVAKGGTDSNDLEGLAAMYELLEQCVSSDEWERFKAHATKVKAEGDALMAVVKETIQALAGRPTSRPSDSSDGPTSTEPSSEDGSGSVADGAEGYLRVVARLEAEGRPDKALQVVRAHEEMTSRA